MFGGSGILLASVLSGLQAAQAVEVGAGFGVRADLDRMMGQDPVVYQQAGPHIHIPARLHLGKGVFAHTSLGLGVNGGQDRVEWSRLDGAVRSTAISIGRCFRVWTIVGPGFAASGIRASPGGMVASE